MASLKQIAEKSGCSLSTVSRALNDSPLISEPVKRRIRAVAQTLGYTPNMQAKVLAGRRARVVGFMASELRYVHDADILRGVEDGAAEAGYSVLSCFYYDNVQRVETYRSLLNQHLFDGIVVGFSGWQWRKESFGTKPVVYVDQWPEDAEPRGVVTSDHHRGADMIAAFLQSAEAARVIYIGQGRRNSVEHTRFTTLKRSCAKADLPFEQVPADAAALEALAMQATAGKTGVVVEPGWDWAEREPSARLRDFCRRSVAAVYDQASEHCRGLFAGGTVLQQDHRAMGHMSFELLAKLMDGKQTPRFLYSPVTTSQFWAIRT